MNISKMVTELMWLWHNAICWILVLMWKRFLLILNSTFSYPFHHSYFPLQTSAHSLTIYNAMFYLLFQSTNIQWIYILKPRLGYLDIPITLSRQWPFWDVKATLAGWRWPSWIRAVQCVCTTNTYSSLASAVTVRTICSTSVLSLWILQWWRSWQK